MADVAMLFHWPPIAMQTMEVGELMAWRQRAVERHNQQHASAD
ncbi:GpE family phage tail protein [Acidovorax sp. Leaf160]|nr:GpE family phage tail protein [Acidovorax sp. Leaf160]